MKQRSLQGIREDF